jgi:glycosyltransferase involved in cell wall biosynthesis
VLSEIDVIVVPSLWYENAPLVIQEAFATKTPVITTNLGGMAEAVDHGINGLLFERGDVADLARQLRRIVNEPELLDGLRAHIPTVKTIDEEVTELEANYRDLIA